MCSTIPSSDGVGLRDGGRAPAAVGDGLHLDRAAPASEGAALLAARPPRRRLQRHPALARGFHRVPSRPVRRILGARVARGLTLRPPVGPKQRYCFYSRDKIYLSPKGNTESPLMEIPQVEAFLAVGTFGGFRRAAEALRLTQPAVSARIRALEDSLSVRLFERGKHGMALSAAGRALRPPADQLLHAVALARPAGPDLRPASGGALRIAAVLSICTYLLPDVLKRFQTAYPKVLITVRAGHSKEVLEMVLRAEAEIGLARSVHHPEVETLSLRDDPLILVARPAAWPGRERRGGPPEGGERPPLFFDPGARGRARTHRPFPPAGPRPTPAPG